jgi:hypothetical protein
MVAIHLFSNIDFIGRQSFTRFKIPEKFLPVDFVPVISGVFKVINVK